MKILNRLKGHPSLTQGTAYAILFSVGFCHLLNDMIQSVIPALYPLLKDKFGFTFAQIGIITLVFQLTSSVFQPFVGNYADRHPQPYSLALGMCFTLVGFGWAKPVAINPSNFRRYRLGLGLTASAGIVMNYLMAFLLYPLLLVVVFYMPDVPFLFDFFYYLTSFLFAYNLSFFVFNLLPLNPLDGFRILDAVDTRKGKVYQFLYRYGQMILLALIAESFLCDIFVRFGVLQMSSFDILGWFMTFATDYLGWPIRALWGLIPW